MGTVSFYRESEGANGMVEAVLEQEFSGVSLRALVVLLIHDDS